MSALVAQVDKCVMHQATSAINEIKLMTNINLPHVLVPGVPSTRSVCDIRNQAQRADLGVHRPHWNY
jgi:hypothetical protein